MAKLNLLVVCAPDLYALRNLEPIRNSVNMHVGMDRATLERYGPEAEIVLYAGFPGVGPRFSEVWPHLKGAKWIHSLSAGVEKLLLPEVIESSVPLTNARGVFKRSLAEFVVLGILYFYKSVPRLIASQRAHHWDNFLVDWLPGKIMGVVGYGEIGRECAFLAKGLGVK